MNTSGIDISHIFFDQQKLPVTLRVTPHWNSDPHFPLTRVCSKTLTVYPFYPQNLNSIFRTPYAQPSPTLPNPPCSIPIPSYPDRGFRNPISDLLIPLLRS